MSNIPSNNPIRIAAITPIKPGNRHNKSNIMAEKVYYSITEVAEMFGLNASVIRFWEKEFPEIKPLKNESGTRRYNAESVEIIRRIYHLTRECGFTLSGAREQLRADRSNLDEKMQLVQTLNEAKAFLLQLKEQL